MHLALSSRMCSGLMVLILFRPQDDEKETTGRWVGGDGMCGGAQAGLTFSQHGVQDLPHRYRSIPRSGDSISLSGLHQKHIEGLWFSN